MNNNAQYLFVNTLQRVLSVHDYGDTLLTMDAELFINCVICGEPDIEMKRKNNNRVQQSCI